MSFSLNKILAFVFTVFQSRSLSASFKRPEFEVKKDSLSTVRAYKTFFLSFKLYVRFSASQIF